MFQVLAFLFFLFLILVRQQMNSKAFHGAPRGYIDSDEIHSLLGITSGIPILLVFGLRYLVYI